MSDKKLFRIGDKVRDSKTNNVSTIYVMEAPYYWLATGDLRHESELELIEPAPQSYATAGYVHPLDVPDVTLSEKPDHYPSDDHYMAQFKDQVNDWVSRAEAAQAMATASPDKFCIGADGQLIEKGMDKYDEALSGLVDCDVGKLSSAELVSKAAHAERKATPVASGVLAYFPDAIRMVARVSKAGNDQHNPGQPLHWAKHKSTDHADCIVRHLLDHLSGVPVDTDGMPHLGKVAWRALALLQTEIEKEGGK